MKILCLLIALVTAAFYSNVIPDAESFGRHFTTVKKEKETKKPTAKPKSNSHKLFGIF